jgi:hypothetical protein
MAVNFVRSGGIPTTEGHGTEESKMRDVYEVLREKESAAERVRREIRALSSAASMLVESTDIEAVLSLQPANRGEVTGSLGKESPRASTEAIHEVRGKAEEARQIAPSPAKRISRRLKRLATPLLSPGHLAG